MTALEQYFGGLSDKRVGVIGAGVSNMPLIRMLRAAGIKVTVHDKKQPTELGAGYATLATLGVDFVLGEHYLDALDEDVIFRTPGVHPRFLEKARENGSEITSEMELFFSVCPCPIIGRQDHHDHARQRDPEARGLYRASGRQYRHAAAAARQ